MSDNVVSCINPECPEHDVPKHLDTEMFTPAEIAAITCGICFGETGPVPDEPPG